MFWFRAELRIKVSLFSGMYSNPVALFSKCFRGYLASIKCQSQWKVVYAQYKITQQLRHPKIWKSKSPEEGACVNMKWKGQFPQLEGMQPQCNQLSLNHIFNFAIIHTHAALNLVPEISPTAESSLSNFLMAGNKKKVRLQCCNSSVHDFTRKYFKFDLTVLGFLRKWVVEEHVPSRFKAYLVERLLKINVYANLW